MPEQPRLSIMRTSTTLLNIVCYSLLELVYVSTLSYNSSGKEAIRGTVASGIRSIFCYCAHPRVKTWQPELRLDNNPLPEGVMDTFRELAAIQPFGPKGRVRLGFAMDTAFVRPQVLKNTFTEVRKLGAHLITSHVTRVSMMDGRSTL
jgi:hypothetical protein